MTPTLVVYGVSLVLVMWAVYDMARRPRDEMQSQRKAIWAISTILGWLVFGIVGAFIALVYLVGPRRRMNASRWN
jgi:hypothetical protein